MSLGDANLAWVDGDHASVGLTLDPVSFTTVVICKRAVEGRGENRKRVDQRKLATGV